MRDINRLSCPSHRAVFLGLVTLQNVDMWSDALSSLFIVVDSLFRRSNWPWLAPCIYVLARGCSNVEQWERFSLLPIVTRQHPGDAPALCVLEMWSPISHCQHFFNNFDLGTWLDWLSANQAPVFHGPSVPGGSQKSHLHDSLTDCVWVDRLVRVFLTASSRGILTASLLSLNSRIVGLSERD